MIAYAIPIDSVSPAPQNTHMKPVATILGLVLAVPAVFVVAMTQVNTLQDTSKGILPSALDGIFGTSTFLVLLLTVVIGVGLIVAAFSLVANR